MVVPTYNERESLPLFLERFQSSGMDLLLVDDNSPDGTGELADGLALERPWMQVLHREEKLGLGVAYRAGFQHCLAQEYELIGQMDADLSHPPERLGAMRDALLEAEADLVLGSRYLPGGGTEGWSRSRLALSRLGCRASSLVLQLPLTDLSGGFKLWRAQCLRDLQLERMSSVGYAFQVEATHRAHLNGARIIELPFLFSERVAGSSKMSPSISREGIRLTLRLRQQTRGARRAKQRARR